MNFKQLVKIYCIFIFSIFFYFNAFCQNADFYLQSSEMHHIMVQFQEDKGSILRFYATQNPMDSRGQVSPYNSPVRRKRLQDLIDEYVKQIEALPFDKFNINSKVDYLLFKRNLESEKYELNEEENRHKQIPHFIPFSGRIYHLVQLRERGYHVDAHQVAKEMNEIIKMVNKSSAELKSMPTYEMAKANTVADAIQGMQGTLKSYFNFYNGYDPLFSWWVPKTYTSLDSVLTKYSQETLKLARKDTAIKPDKSGIVGKPIGRQELIRQLKLEYIPYTPEELIDIANKEFAWCDAELLKATKEMGFGTDWKAAQEKVKNSYVAPGHQPEAMLDLYNQSVAFLKKHDLVTIPPIAEETWRVNMMAPERQLVSPFFLGGESLIISYPTNSMSYEDKMMSMRGNNPHFSRATVHHELIAGHHLQRFMINRYKNYRNFETPFWTEGNALYWEFLLWDMNFPRSPEDRIGMLFWRMHRCARIIFSMKYHLGEWTPQECIDFLVDRVGHERANAEGEVRRSFTGNYGPLYQMAYMLGGLQFYALKKELVDNKKMTIKEFHDAILKENSIPVEMLRAILTKQDIKKDFTTRWRFYNPKT